MEHLKVTCMGKSLKANSKALFILAKLSKTIKKESPLKTKYIKVN